MARKCMLFLECTAEDEEQCPKLTEDRLQANEGCFYTVPGPEHSEHGVRGFKIKCPLFKVEETEVMV